MIDLRLELPNKILAGDEWVEVETDFRAWLQFGELLKEKIAYTGIFKGDTPKGDWLESAIEFFKSETATPKPEKQAGRYLDLILDGDYIVGAFQQAYGIDLTSCEMHWHRFKALLSSLPEETMLRQIMSYRSWKKSNEKHEATMAKLRERWRLPEDGEEQAEKELLEWMDAIMGEGA